MNLKKIALIGILSVLIVFFCFNIAKGLDILSKNKINNNAKLEIAGISLDIDVVFSKNDQEKGLSGRKELKDNEGMFFVFAKTEPHFLWMKNMNFPIDMIWFDENYKLIFCVENALPDSYPHTFGPNQNSRYILEVNAGFCKKNNLKIGERALFLP